MTGATIALHLLIDTGLMAPVRGWVRRTERLLTPGEPEVADAMLAMIGTYERFLSGDPLASRAHAERALELGDRLGFPRP